MGTTDVRARLAEALRGHQRNPYGQHDGWWECSCSTDEPHTPEHMADVLLSLEGVAIVALPEPTAAGNFPTQEVEDPLVWQVRATRAGSTPLVSYGEKLMPAWYARRLAAALLAAAAEVDR